MKTKTCTTCKRDKELTEFYKNSMGKGGLNPSCKSCKSEYAKARRAANHPEILAREQAQRDARGGELKDYNQRYKAANLEAIRAAGLRYSRKMRADPIARGVDMVRCNILKIFHGTGSNPEALELLGCTGQDYRDHLESLWTEGMSWDNHGTSAGHWQIDHVIPVSSFDHTDPEQRKICWNYRNTQPLWMEDNQAKGAKLPTESTNE